MSSYFVHFLIHQHKFGPLAGKDGPASAKAATVDMGGTFRAIR